MYELGGVIQHQEASYATRSCVLETRSSAVAKRPRDASCLSVANFNNTKRPAQSFIVSYVGIKDPPTISSIADDVEDTLFKSIQKRSTCIAALSGRATATALQPQKPTWNQQDSDWENCGPHDRDFYAAPSSVGGCRILRRTLSVRLSVCLSVRPSRARKYFY